MGIPTVDLELDVIGCRGLSRQYLLYPWHRDCIHIGL